MSSEIQTKEQLDALKAEITDQLKNESNYTVTKFSQGNDFQIDFIYAKSLDKNVTIQPFPLTLIEECSDDIQLLQNCNHKNIIKYIEETIGDTTYLPVFEETEQTLQEYIDSHKGKKIPEEDFAKFAYQLLDAIEYLHQKDYFLKDFSLRSILLDKKQNIKVTSITQALKITKKNATEKFVQSENSDFKQIFYPPEFLYQDNNSMEVEEPLLQCTKQADIWAYGMCMYALCGATPKNVVQQTIGVDIELEDQVNLSEDFFLLLIEILQKQPSDRCTIENIRSRLTEIYSEFIKEEKEDTSKNMLNIIQDNQESSYNNKGYMNPNPYQMFNTSQSQITDFGGSAFSQGFRQNNYAQNQPIRSYKKEPEPEIEMSNEELQSASTYEELLKKGTYLIRRLKEYTEAIACLKLAIQKNRKEVEAYIRLGEAYQLGNRLEEGMAYFKELENYKEQIDLLISEQGKILYHQKKYDDALELFNKANDMNENNKTFFSLCAAAYNNVGKHDFAIFYCRLAQRVDPHDWFPPYNLGYAYLKKKKPDVAIQFLTEAYEIESNLETNLAMGQSYHESKDFNKAIEYYKIAIEKNPKSDQAYYLLGLSYLSNEKISLAIDNFKMALQINPLNIEAQQSLAKTQK